MTESRFQVDTLKINGQQEIKSPITDEFHENHLDYLSSPDESGVNKPILSADFKKLDGSYFHDPRFVFSYATKEGGKQSETTSVPVAEPAGGLTAEALTALTDEATEDKLMQL